MRYPGNPALSTEIQRRITTTFSQTLELAAKGNRQEALLGADFILKMDPAFVPARSLRERVAKAEEGSPIPVADLELRVAEEPSSPAPSLAGGLETMSLPAFDLEPAEPVDVLAAALQDLLDKRELRRLVQVAEENRQEVAASAAARRVVETAYGRLEAEPYVQSFLDAARQAVERQDLLEAASLLDKARQLDVSHPGIAEIEQLKMAARPAAPQLSFAMPPQSSSAAASLQQSEGLMGVFDAPELAATPAPPRASGGGGDGRIAELLADGQAHSDRGDYQGAIDAWSRIFLIDIDHEEASRRIEGARRQKAESERQVEEIYHGAVSAYEVGDFEAARQGFERVLAISPGHFAAREQLELLDRDLDADVPSPTPVAFEPTPPTPGVRPDDIMVPPAPGARAEASRPAVKPMAAPRPSAGRPNLRFLLIGGTVLLVVLGILGFAWMERDRLFPNRAEQQRPAGARDPLARATGLHDKGEVDAAIRSLEKLPSDDPHFSRAQELIKTWKAELEATARPAAAPDPATAARLERELTRARDAFRNAEYLLADSYYKRAAKLSPLAGEDVRQAAEAAARLEPLAQALRIYKQEDWAALLPDLWRLHEKSPENRDVTRLMVNCYYNLAVRALQGGDAEAAVRNFDEALGLNPGSPVLTRHKQFAQAYLKRPKDLLYRIYVNHLPTL